MKALSIKQPWAWLICAGYKDIENRNWKIGRNARHGPYSSYHQANFTIELPARIYVHASKNEDFTNMYAAFKTIESIHGSSDGEIIQKNYILYKTFGAIIGEVDIVDCVMESDSIWFNGPYGFVLKNPVLYERAIPHRGALGFFEVVI